MADKAAPKAAVRGRAVKAPKRNMTWDFVKTFAIFAVLAELVCLLVYALAKDFNILSAKVQVWPLIVGGIAALLGCLWAQVEKMAKTVGELFAKGSALRKYWLAWTFVLVLFLMFVLTFLVPEEGLTLFRFPIVWMLMIAKTLLGWSFIIAVVKLSSRFAEQKAWDGPKAEWKSIMAVALIFVYICAAGLGSVAFYYAVKDPQHWMSIQGVIGVGDTATTMSTENTVVTMSRVWTSNFPAYIVGVFVSAVALAVCLPILIGLGLLCWVILKKSKAAIEKMRNAKDEYEGLPYHEWLRAMTITKSFLSLVISIIVTSAAWPTIDASFAKYALAFGLGFGTFSITFFALGAFIKTAHYAQKPAHKIKKMILVGYLLATLTLTFTVTELYSMMTSGRIWADTKAHVMTNVTEFNNLAISRTAGWKTVYVGDEARLTLAQNIEAMLSEGKLKAERATTREELETAMAIYRNGAEMIADKVLLPGQTIDLGVPPRPTGFDLIGHLVFGEEIPGIKRRYWGFLILAIILSLLIDYSLPTLVPISYMLSPFRKKKVVKRVVIDQETGEKIEMDYETNGEEIVRPSIDNGNQAADPNQGGGPNS